jgi:CubicO group peptidase (beta-lactamase class C family)
LYIVITSTVVAALAGCAGSGLDDGSIQAFELDIERLREEWKIPGMSIAVLHNQELGLARGFGFADLENRVPATENTPYNLASCTKPIAAVILMQFVEEGRLNLDAPIVDILENTLIPIKYRGQEFRGYASFFESLRDIIEDASNPLSSEFRSTYGDYHLDTESITVRHHLTHTSEGIPGETYRYSGDLYSFLSFVVNELSGKRFDEVLVERLTSPLGMVNTVPNINDSRRDSILANRSKYYRVGKGGEFVEAQENRPVKWPDVFEELGLEIERSFLINAGAGMVSTVVDMAKFDVALDRNILLSKKYKDLMFTASMSNSGERLPYGLGWFVQEIHGKKVVWHFGYAGIHSSLIMKIPEEEKTLILLANSGGASAEFNLGAGDVLGSPFASAFITHLTDLMSNGPK